MGLIEVGIFKGYPIQLPGYIMPQQTRGLLSSVPRQALDGLRNYDVITMIDKVISVISKAWR